MPTMIDDDARTRVSDRSRRRPIAGTAVGLCDAALVQTGLAGAAGAFQFVPARIWIVAPLVWVLIAAAAGLLVLPIMKRWGGVAVPAILAVLFLSIRLRLHLAVLAVALGLLAVLLAVTSRWMLRWMATPRKTIAVGVLGAAAASAIAAAAPPLRLSAAPVSGAAGPNVILIFLDTVRYDAVFDAEGRVAARLPTLARVRSESTAFTHAYSSSSWTLPAHLSAVTGLPAHQLGISFDSQIYARQEQTLAERFRRRGYRTAAVISNSFLNAGSGFARGFDTFQQAQAALDLCRTAPGLMADAHWPWFSAAVCNWTASEVTSARPRAHERCERSVLPDAQLHGRARSVLRRAELRRRPRLRRGARLPRLAASRPSPTGDRRGVRRCSPSPAITASCSASTAWCGTATRSTCHSCTCR
jgi:hypothetical protein